MRGRRSLGVHFRKVSIGEMIVNLKLLAGKVSLFDVMWLEVASKRAHCRGKNHNDLTHLAIVENARFGY